MEYIIGLVAALLGALWYTNNKKNQAEALNRTLDTKERDLEKKEQIMKNDATVKAEASTIESIKKDLEDKKNEELTTDDLLKFFNDRK